MIDAVLFLLVYRRHALRLTRLGGRLVGVPNGGHCRRGVEALT
ncbi:MAG TPA: hypothetical protein VIJ28_05585 [Chloroflexota bacterium]